MDFVAYITETIFQKDAVDCVSTRAIFTLLISPQRPLFRQSGAAPMVVPSSYSLVIRSAVCNVARTQLVLNHAHTPVVRITAQQWIPHQLPGCTFHTRSAEVASGNATS